jgi:hypothetical protein
METRHQRHLRPRNRRHYPPGYHPDYKVDSSERVRSRNREEAGMAGCRPLKSNESQGSKTASLRSRLSRIGDSNQLQSHDREGVVHDCLVTLNGAVVLTASFRNLL